MFPFITGHLWMSFCNLSSYMMTYCCYWWAEPKVFQQYNVRLPMSFDKCYSATAAAVPGPGAVELAAVILSRALEII